MPTLPVSLVHAYQSVHLNQVIQSGKSETHDYSLHLHYSLFRSHIMISFSKKETERETERQTYRQRERGIERERGIDRQK